MKVLQLLACSAIVGLAGCATAPEQYAQNDCKIVPMKPGYISGTYKAPDDKLAQRQAEMDLASTPYRMRLLNRPGFNNIEDALRDCY
jgi:hypothetical protein